MLECILTPSRDLAYVGTAAPINPTCVQLLHQFKSQMLTALSTLLRRSLEYKLKVSALRRFHSCQEGMALRAPRRRSLVSEGSGQELENLRRAHPTSELG
jgi:hypothetical protein